MGDLVKLEDIQDRIFKIRGQTVMLDRDLAALYGMRTIALRQQVRRNMDHFPEDFVFQLTQAEAALLVSQRVIPSGRSLGGYLPLVFTEEVDMHDADIRLLVQDVQKLKKQPGPAGPINPSVL